MPRPNARQHRCTFLLNQAHTFRLTGDYLSKPSKVDILEMNPKVAWTSTTFNYVDSEKALYVTSTPKPVTHPVTDDSPVGDGSMTIVVTNPPDQPGDPSQPDQSPPQIPAYYSSSQLGAAGIPS